MGVDSTHVLHEIMIDETKTPRGEQFKTGKADIMADCHSLSPASVLQVENMSDTWSRSSRTPTDESSSSGTSGTLRYMFFFSFVTMSHVSSPVCKNGSAMLAQLSLHL